MNDFLYLCFIITNTVRLIRSFEKIYRSIIIRFFFHFTDVYFLFLAFSIVILFIYLFLLRKLGLLLYITQNGIVIWDNTCGWFGLFSFGAFTDAFFLDLMKEKHPFFGELIRNEFEYPRVLFIGVGRKSDSNLILLPAYRRI